MEAPAAEPAHRGRRDIRRRSERPHRNDEGEHGEPRCAPIQAQTDPNADALVKAVGGEPDSAGRGLAQDGVKAAITGAKTPAEIVSKAVDALKATSALLDAKGGRTPRRSRPGLPASPNRSPRPHRKAASSGLAGSR